MKRSVLWMSVFVIVLSLGVGFVYADGKMSMININTADEAALVTLDQVGKSRAQAIIQYRQEYGPFKSVEDLKRVSGVGDKIYEAIKSRITVEEGQQ